MVVDDLHGAGTTGVPLEDQAPLIVDPNRMKSFPPALQRLETVAGWRPEVAELRGVVQVQELATCRPPQFGWKATRRSGRAVVEQILGQAVAEAPYHHSTLSDYDNYVQEAEGTGGGSVGSLSPALSSEPIGAEPSRPFSEGSARLDDRQGVKFPIWFPINCVGREETSRDTVVRAAFQLRVRADSP